MTVAAVDLIRYYQNVCEYGYSFVWWKWLRWERHIDWMALNGINMALAESGQEFVFLKTFMQFGMTRKEVQNHFTGPAFLPWNRMGNLNSWAGPLPMSWIESDRQLQHKILGRMRELGIAAAVPAFNGIVPRDFISKHPNVTYDRLRRWGHFSEKYSSSFLLDPASSLFAELSAAYLGAYSSEYGGNHHFFNLDTFNEMTPPRKEGEYIKNYGRAAFSALKSFDSRAIWLMQGWLFRDKDFWTKTRARALITSVPTGRMLILDLAATTSPQYTRLDSFFGQPWLFCMLHNYGGVQGLYGMAPTVNSAPYTARNTSTSTSLVGLGVTPEGLHNSYAMYDLLLEVGWRQQPVHDLSAWFNQFAERRYGRWRCDDRLRRAWRLIAESAFNCCKNATRRKSGKEFRFHGKTTLTSMPSLALKRNLWYNEQTVLLAWDEMIASVHNNSLAAGSSLKHDLIDLSRQSLSNALFPLYHSALQAYYHNDSAGLEQSASEFLSLVSDLDTLLSSSQHFLLGSWLRDAKLQAGSNNPFQKMLFEFNARNQVTLWGPQANILDYAAKQWGGLVRGYYLPRWKLFFKSLNNYDEQKFKEVFVREIGIPFTLARDLIPAEPEGEPIEIAKRLHEKWRKRI